MTYGENSKFSHNMGSYEIDHLLLSTWQGKISKFPHGRGFVWNNAI
jgi:hypothetical protein